ncbi:MAG: hypothetical protein NZ552_04875 [Planctomycetes bacterium]|nr:hypothetical protein [Planctomycetota bacterium]
MRSPIGLTSIVPSLALAALASVGSAGETSPRARDAHLEAIIALIENDFRLPAERQIAAFRAAGYPESGWFEKFLAWYHADRFRTKVLDKSLQTRLTQEAKALGDELQQAVRAKQLPKVLADKLSGSAVVYRLINELGRVIGQDQVPPPGGLTNEERTALEQTVRALVAAAIEHWDSARKAVQANAKDEETFQQLNEQDPRYQEGARRAVELRLEAVRPIFFAAKMLREVIERGKDYGISDKLARDWLRDFVTTNFELLSDWDYYWSDYHPYLRAILADLMGQAVRFKHSKANLEEVTQAMRAVIDMDLKPYERDPQTADEIRTLQARCWSGLIAWYRELGKEVNARWYQTGLDAYQEFREKTRNDKHFRLDHPDRDRQVEVARIHFQGGRLLQARGDPAAAGAFGVVAALRTHPLAGNAQLWMSYLSRGGGSSPAAASSSWGAQPSIEDPRSALVIANALLRQATASGDPAVQRQALQGAAAALRNGLAGVQSPLYAEAVVDTAPELWFRYAECLNRMQLRWHAAVVANAGLRWFDARIKTQRGQNPWRGKDGKWTTPGAFIGRLARNAVVYASQLNAIGRNSAINQLYDDTISLVNSVSPEDGGKSLERIQVIIAIQEADYRRALELSKRYLDKYPEEFYDASSLRSFVYSSWLNKMSDAAERRRVAEQAMQEARAVAQRAAKDLETATDPARKRVLRQAMRDGQTLEAVVALAEGNNERVLQMLGPDYWRDAPSEPEKAAEMLGYLCRALRQWYQAEMQDTAKRADAALLVRNWPRIQAVYDIYRTQKERLTAQAEKVERQGIQIAWVFNTVANVQAPAMRQQPNAPPELAEIQRQAMRAYADLIEPTFDAKSRLDLILQVANVLWELDEQARACRLFQLYLDGSAGDSELAALRDRPRETLAALDAILRARPELRAKWELVVDLLHDDPELSRKILELDLPESEWREQKRDYVRAVAALRELRGDVERVRLSLGNDYKTVDEGLKKLEGQLQQLVREVSVMQRLAAGLRGLGEKAKANALYEKLIAYDPTNPEFLAAAVELTIDRLRAGEAVAAADLEKARIKAARVRDSAQNGSPTYWTAVIQVLELSVAMKDLDLVNRRLRFDAVNQSTPADDLQVRPRNPRDDPRVRRARNQLAVELCRRYLAIFAQSGVTAKPSYEIREVAVDGQPQTIFVPVGAPSFVAQRRELDDGSVVWFFWEEGKEPPPEPETPRSGPEGPTMDAAGAVEKRAASPTPQPAPTTNLETAP